MHRGTRFGSNRKRSSGRRFGSRTRAQLALALAVALGLAVVPAGAQESECETLIGCLQEQVLSTVDGLDDEAAELQRQIEEEIDNQPEGLLAEAEKVQQQAEELKAQVDEEVARKQAEVEALRRQAEDEAAEKQAEAEEEADRRVQEIMAKAAEIQAQAEALQREVEEEVARRAEQVDDAGEDAEETAARKQAQLSETAGRLQDEVGAFGDALSAEPAWWQAYGLAQAERAAEETTYTCVLQGTTTVWNDENYAFAGPVDCVRADHDAAAGGEGSSDVVSGRFELAGPAPLFTPTACSYSFAGHGELSLDGAEPVGFDYSIVTQGGQGALTGPSAEGPVSLVPTEAIDDPAGAAQACTDPFDDGPSGLFINSVIAVQGQPADASAEAGDHAEELAGAAESAASGSGDAVADEAERQQAEAEQGVDEQTDGLIDDTVATVFDTVESIGDALGGLLDNPTDSAPPSAPEMVKPANGEANPFGEPYALEVLATDPEGHPYTAEITIRDADTGEHITTVESRPAASGMNAGARNDTLLPPGDYELEATATDATGQAGEPSVGRFSVYSISR